MLLWVNFAASVGFVGKSIYIERKPKIAVYPHLLTIAVLLGAYLLYSFDQNAGYGTLLVRQIEACPFGREVY